jgi:hypothetical protein
LALAIVKSELLSKCGGDFDGFRPEIGLSVELPGSIVFIRQSKVRALAVTTTTRSPALPDIPALAEFIPG